MILIRYLNRLNSLYDDNMNGVSEYYTDQHASPLVALSTLKIMYFKGEGNYGYFIHTVKGNDIRLMLDSQIVESRGGDFRITRHANGRAHRQIWNPVNGFKFVCTAWTFEWNVGSHLTLAEVHFL